jgi:hypothetical protein
MGSPDSVPETRIDWAGRLFLGGLSTLFKTATLLTLQIGGAST